MPISWIVLLPLLTLDQKLKTAAQNLNVETMEV
jgi:hypothetical protein